MAYVIFHEFTHQITAEHNDDFYKRMSEYTIDNNVEKRLDDCLDSAELKPAETQSIHFELGKNTVICMVESTKKDIEAYRNELFYFDHYVMGSVKKNLPKEFCKDVISQVVWVIKNENQYWIVGWAKDVHFYSKDVIIDCEDMKMGCLRFDFMYKRDNGFHVFPINASMLCETDELPKDFDKTGMCFASDIYDGMEQDIVNWINAYDLDVVDCGISETVLDLEVPFEFDSIADLEVMSFQEKHYMRKIWLLNKLCSKKPSFKAFYERAKAFAAGEIYDYALDDLARAIHYPMESASKKELEEIEKNFSLYATMYQRFVAVVNKFE